jgi:hypothetical protein
MKRRGMTWDEVCRLAQALPSVEGGSYHGYPALRVAGKFLTRLGDDRESLEFKGLDAGEREMLLSTRPKVFFLPEGFHGRGVFARLSALDMKTLQPLLERQWQRVAPKALIREREAR